MHLRAVGENPEAAASVGINVKRIRYYALLISGFFAGLGGIHISMGYLQLFQRDMTNGRGFIRPGHAVAGRRDAHRRHDRVIDIRLLRRAGHPHRLAGDPLAAAAVDSLFRDRAGAGHLCPAAPHLPARQRNAHRLGRRLRRRLLGLDSAHQHPAHAADDGGGHRRGDERAILSAPNGFGGAETALPAGLLIGVASVALFLIGLPFVRNIFSIRENWRASALVTIVSLGIYLTLFLTLFFQPLLALIISLVLSAAVWFMIGGRVLMRGRNSAKRHRGREGFTCAHVNAVKMRESNWRLRTQCFAMVTTVTPTQPGRRLSQQPMRPKRRLWRLIPLLVIQLGFDADESRHDFAAF